MNHRINMNHQNNIEKITDNGNAYADITGLNVNFDSMTCKL